MATSEYQLIAQQALALPAEDQLRLIQQLAEKLSRSQKPTQPQYLEYGKYRDTQGKRIIARCRD